MPSTPIRDVTSKSHPFMTFGNVAVMGNTIIINAPGPNKRIVLTRVVLQQSGALPAAGWAAQLRDSNNNRIEQWTGAIRGDGVSIVYAPDARPALDENAALVFVNAVAINCNYTIHYFIESVP